MKNIELKVKLNNFKLLKLLLRQYKARYIGDLTQIDTYYDCKNGRIKMREINSRQFELIFYKRANSFNSKISVYQILRVEKNNYKLFKQIFQGAFGIKRIIRKNRQLWLLKNTRIHLDNVAGLGSFVELETVCNKVKYTFAKREHQNILNTLKLKEYQKISKSYSDL
ncbi:MAG: class IV adenylate cyclase [Patescibacteria group bacterium]